MSVEIDMDADRAGSITDHRSTLDNCNFIGGNLVTLRCKKQLIVSRSIAWVDFDPWSWELGQHYRSRE